MKVTDENQDEMDCRPGTGQPSAIAISPRLQAAVDQRRAEDTQRRREAAEDDTRSDRTDGQADRRTS